MKPTCAQGPIKSSPSRKREHDGRPWRRCRRAITTTALRAAIGVILPVTSLLSGCAGAGPSSIVRDRFDYVTAVSDSWKRQMLLNLLKVRYSDAPVFMDVASVINSYELGGELNLSGQVADKLNSSYQGNQSLSFGASGRYVDRPTITYLPLSGDKFTRSLMVPIPISGILFLIQSGYPADLVLRVCTSSMNGLQNYYGAQGSMHSTGDPKFVELLSAFREAQSIGGLGMRMKAVNNNQVVVIFFRPSAEGAVAASLGRIRDLLALDPSGTEFTVTYGTYPENSSEIAVQSRSILQVMTDLASYVDVPEKDLLEGRVRGGRRTPEQERLFPPLLSVRTGPSAPDDAYVSVRYRNQWYWIDDRDVPTKGIFSFMMFMFSLTETGGAQAAPIVTVPAR